MNRPATEPALDAAGGFLLLDKPVGISSFRAIDTVRGALGVRKCGHGGTLDPAARGLLVLAFGFSTKLLSFCLGLDKTYEAEVVFGVSTDTLDLAGRVLESVDACPPREAAEAALAAFLGDTEQIPPIFSALKQDGHALYRTARRGGTIDMTAKARTVSITEIAPLSYEPGRQARMRFRMRCSGGTYVRAVARDLGAALGVPAALAGLTRTAVGPHRLEDACGIEAVTPARIVPPGPFLAPLGIASYPLADEPAHRFRNGHAVPLHLPPGTLALACDGGGAPLGLARAHADGLIHPLKVVGGPA